MNKKTIWITGGSTGIGKALAIKFASKGWNVAISARRENLLKEISDNNENIYGFPLDVTDSEKCKIVFNDLINIDPHLLIPFLLQIKSFLISILKFFISPFNECLSSV